MSELATFGGGCFWCLDAVFREIRGVEDVSSGYAGGRVAHPTYPQVCTGTTGHAEVAQIRFDPEQVSYRDLLAIFFTLHDPTTVDRQGNDIGSQYRSVIFFHSPEQQAQALEAAREARQIWGKPVVTQIEPLDVFYPAEAYHQDYFARNPLQPYCQAVVAPKVAKVRKAFLDKLRP